VKKDEEVILRSDPRAARRVTVEGWVSRHGHFYGEDERTARYDGATHNECEHCGSVCEKHYTACRPCRARLERERHERREHVPYPGGPIFIEDEFCFDDAAVTDELWEYLRARRDPWAVMVLEAVPQPAEEIDLDHWQDALPDEEGDPPAWLEEAVERLNATIREHRDRPLSWTTGERAIDPATLPWPTDYGMDEEDGESCRQ